MAEFIVVSGDDPFYKPRKTSLHVAFNTIHRAYPIFAEKGEDGDYYRCTPEHPNAELIGYRLVDFQGKEYDCAVDECKKFGIGEPEETHSIGFFVREPREQ